MRLATLDASPLFRLAERDGDLRHTRAWAVAPGLNDGPAGGRRLLSSDRKGAPMVEQSRGAPEGLVAYP